MNIEPIEWRYAGRTPTYGMTVWNAYHCGKPLPWQAVKNPRGGYILQEYDRERNVGKAGHEVGGVYYENRLVDAGHRVWRHENAREQGAWADDARSKLSTNFGE